MTSQSVQQLTCGWRPLAACALSALMAAVCWPLAGLLDQANIVMLFLLAVAGSAVWFGRGAAVLAAFVSVGLFDFLFVEPRFSFAVRDGQYLVTFAVMLLVALLISQLSTRLQHQLSAARRRERATHALYDCARTLAGAVEVSQIVAALRHSSDGPLAGATVRLYLPDAGEQLQCCDDAQPVPAGEALILETVSRSGEMHETHPDGRQGAATVYLPLIGATRQRGVLVLTLPPGMMADADRQPFLAALASLVATAVERLHFVDVAQQHALQIQAERLRSSILSALSHDIRTPLTVLCGLADTLRLTHADLPASAADMLATLGEQARSLHSRVENLLDMARLQSGRVPMQREWLPLEEVVGSSIKLLGESLAQHHIRVSIPADLPLVQLDALLFERVLCNLLENAAKYSPVQSDILLSAACADGQIEIRVCNAGEGFPPGSERLFELFERGSAESSAPGFGLGLAICRSIVTAHGGTIRIVSPEAGGACVQINLPMGEPPAMAPEAGPEVCG